MTTIQPKSNVVINSKIKIINPKVRGVDSICSCHKCESSMCFAKRNGNRICSCTRCTNSKTCLFYSNDKAKIKDSHWNNFNLLQNNKDSLNTSVRNDDPYHGHTNINTETVIENQDTLLPENLKDTSDNELNKHNEIFIPQVENIPVESLRKEINSPTAKLSAQIMDLPYSDFKESLTHNKSDISSNTIINTSKFDIFTRIKEIYEACSCKICECVVGNILPSKNDLCTCKPCDCDECTKYNLNKNVYVNGVLVSGCPCVRCANPNCKSIVKKKDETLNEKNCDCEPCDCINYTESFSKPCDCEPCQCIECKSMSLPKYKAIIVAPVGEDRNQRNACQCRPCECIQCGHNNGTSTLMHEMSTGLNRHQNCHCEACVDESCTPDTNETCKCERRNSFMRKPVQRDTYEFDVRHAVIPNEIPIRDKDESNGNSYIMAMFSALTNYYPKFALEQKKACDCDQCECLICNSQENTTNSMKYSQLFHIDNELSDNMYKRSLKTCKCSPCECQFCNKRLNQENRNLNIEGTSSKTCECNDCVCMICDAMMQQSFRKAYVPKSHVKFSSRRICDCNPCECNKCQMKHSMENFKYYDKTEYANEKFGDIMHPERREKLQRPAIIEKNIFVSNNSKHSQCFDYDRTCSLYQKNFPAQDKALHKDVSINQTLSRNSSTNIDLITIEESPWDENKKLQYFTSPSKTQNYKTINQFNNTKFRCNKQYLNSKSGTSISDFSDSLPKTNEESESVLPFTMKKYNLKLRNSAVKDSSDYLIRDSTKSYERTVEKCINDVMEINVNENINFNHNSAISKETGSGINYNSYKDHAQQHLYVTTVISNRNKEIAAHKTVNNSSVQVDLVTSHEKAILIKNKTNERLYRKFKKYGKTESAQTVPETYTIPNNDIYLPLQFGVRKNFNISEPYIARQSYSTVDIINKYILNKPILNSVTIDGNLSRKYANHYLPVLRNNTTDYFQLGINYERIQRTLYQARTFSLYLENLLRKYEKNNLEFVSISDKLKVDQYSLPKTSNSLPLERVIFTSKDTEAYSNANLGTVEGCSEYNENYFIDIKNSRDKISYGNKLENSISDNDTLYLNEEFKNQSQVNPIQGMINNNQSKNTQASPVATLVDSEKTTFEDNNTKVDVVSSVENDNNYIENLNQELWNPEFNKVSTNENLENKLEMIKCTSVDTLVSLLKTKITDYSTKDTVNLKNNRIDGTNNNLNQELRSSERINDDNKEEIFKTNYTKFDYIMRLADNEQYIFRDNHTKFEDDKYPDNYIIGFANKLNQELRNVRNINATDEIIHYNQNLECAKSVTNDKLESCAITSNKISVNHIPKTCGTYFLTEKDAKEINKERKMNSIDIKSGYRRYRKLIKRAIVISKRFNAASGSRILKISTATETSNTFISITKYNNEKSVTVENDKGFDSKTEEQPKDKNKQRQIKVHEVEIKNIATSATALQIQGSVGTKLWPICKTNIDFYQEPLTTNNKKLNIFSNLERKEATVERVVHDFNLQRSSYTESIKDNHENKALAKLRVEVQNLLNMPILQTKSNNVSLNSQRNMELQIDNELGESTFNDTKEPIYAFDRGELENRSQSAVDLQRHIKQLLELSIVYPVTKRCTQKSDNGNRSIPTDFQNNYVSSIKSSCEAQKVSFLGLRRVSDHTVLVKWNTPQVMTNVQGYELLVDGCAVQKLINPAKCMAVVTCLPHSDKVLLTIKTILLNANRDHFPTTSIVYRPRIRF